MLKGKGTVIGKEVTMASDSETDERFAVLGESDNEGSENEGSEEEKEQDEEEQQEEEEQDRISPELTVKKKKPGVIYLSSVPDGMNVTQTTAFFSEFGRVGRVFLQPDKTDRQKGKYNRVFSEGWVEFMSKKVARGVAEKLNCQMVGGKRRSKAHDQIWNIKYLPRFKWVHLSERLAYEAAVRQQRLRTEISQVKREAEHFKSSVENRRKKSRAQSRAASSEGKEQELARGKGGQEQGKVQQPFLFHQKETESQIRKRKVEEVVNTEAPEVKKKKSKKSKAAPKDPVSATGPDKIKVKKGKKKKESKGAFKGKPKDVGDRSALLKSVFGGGGS